ncbi:MAG: hypothetical protein E7369_03540 [Clostridiales bacterium]|nr:hypothetical protein [Clostridiales bacterium]
MKMAKSRNLILLITALVLCIVASLASFNFSTVKADTLSATDYFYLNGEVSEKVVLADNSVKATVENGDVLKLKNKILVHPDIFSITLKASSEIKVLKINFTGEAENVNGHLNLEGEFDKQIKNTIVIDTEDETFKIGDGNTEPVYDITEAPTEIYIAYNVVADGLHRAETENSEYYKLKTVGKYALISVEFEFVLDEGASGVFNIFEINGNYTTEDYAQNFEIDEEDPTKFTKNAKPLITFDDSSFIYSSNVYKVVEGFQYKNFKPTVHSVLGSYGSEDIQFDYSVENGFYYTSNKTLCFIKSGLLTVKFDGQANGQKFDIAVVESEIDVYAPVYVAAKVGNEYINEYKSFVAAFQSKLVSEGTYGEDDAIYVSLGSNEYLELPSMQDLVSDDVTSYANLTKTVHYTTPVDSGTNSNMKIPLKAQGKYTFYVTFEDKNGNEINTSDFVRVDPDDSNKVIYGSNADYIFSFEVLDNAPIKVTKASSQGEGFIGVKYTAAKFKVVASSYNEEYKLYYSADKNAEDSAWVEIPKASSVTDTEYNENGLTYDDVKAIAYDGSMTFTPNEKGYYKITCTVESDVTGRRAEATTDIIEVNDKPQVVKPDSKWLQNNVWSVVFLSIGTLCLIGIIVLLCIKPKEETDIEE